MRTLTNIELTAHFKRLCAAILGVKRSFLKKISRSTLMRSVNSRFSSARSASQFCQKIKMIMIALLHSEWDVNKLSLISTFSKKSKKRMHSRSSKRKDLKILLLGGLKSFCQTSAVYISDHLIHFQCSHCIR